jgi:hypothetical protein
LIGLVPWTAFLGLPVWYAWRQARSSDGADGGKERAAVRFLICWFAVYLVFFSIVSTKLPNYILPLYPAAALLTARVLERWRLRELSFPAWVMRLGMSTLALIGVLAVVGMLIGGGVIVVPALQPWTFPGMAWWAFIGGIPLVGAAVGFRMLQHDRRNVVVGAVSVAAILFISTLAGGVLETINPQKPSRSLAEELPADQLYQDIRIGACDYFQPSLVFYCQREVKNLPAPESGLVFLSGPLPSYLILRERTWQQIRDQAPPGVRVLAKRREMYFNDDVVLVANEPAVSRMVAAGRTD